MTNKQKQFIEALEGSNFSSSLAYAKTYGRSYVNKPHVRGYRHTILNATSQLLRNTEVLDGIIEMLDQLPVKSLNAEYLYAAILKKRIKLANASI